jgi:hypothetical protein
MFDGGSNKVRYPQLLDYCVTRKESWVTIEDNQYNHVINPTFLTSYQPFPFKQTFIQRHRISNPLILHTHPKERTNETLLQIDNYRIINRLPKSPKQKAGETQSGTGRVHLLQFALPCSIRHAKMKQCSGRMSGRIVGISRVENVTSEVYVSDK